MSINKVNISTNSTNVTVVNDNKKIVISDNIATNNVIINQNDTKTIQVRVPGPQGPVGPVGPTPSTASFVQSGSFNEFTSSYYTDSSSFENRITDLELFSSSLDDTFVTETELGIVTASLSSSISSLSSSFELFSSSYNTSSFKGNLDGTASYSETASYVNPLIQTVEVTGSLKLSGSFINNGLTYPLVDGDTGDILTTDGEGNLTFDRTRIYAQVKNISGGTLQKGTPVHVISTAGNTDEVIAASASNASTMPATFVLAQTLDNGEEGLGILTGFINGVDTSDFGEGDIVYVAANGGYTNVKPTGSNLIQNLGIVTKVAENGSGFIYGSGRANDVPNITPGYAWVGNTDGVATPTPTSSFSSGSFSGSFEGDGNGLTNIPASGIVGLNLTRIATTDTTASVSNGEDVFKITSGSSTPFIIKSGSGNIGIGTTSPSTLLEVNGVVSGTGSGLIDLKATETNLQQTLTANQTIGGVSSGQTFSVGTDIEDILRQILITYIPPSFGSLSLKNNSSTISTSARDAGNSFTINSASFTATADSPTGIFPLSSSFTASGADIGDINYYFGDNVISTSNNFEIGNTYTLNITTPSTSGTSITFRVRGKRSDNDTFISDSTVSVPFRWRNYLAASSTIISDNTTAQTVIDSAVVQSTLDTNRAWTAVCGNDNNDASNFTYIIYPSGYGDLSGIVQDGATPVLGAFTKIGDFTISNTYTSSRTFRVYKSNSPGAFSSGTTLAIS